MKRTFIYTDEKSNKFWTIEVNGNSYTVNYGKAGTAGQTQTKDFADETACQKAADKLIAEKTKKGYVEQSGESEDTTENKSSKVLKEIIVEADTFSGYAYLVDLDDKESINNTLNAVIKHLDSDEVMERIENDDFLYPEYGQMEDDEFVEHESHPYRSSEDRFFSEAVSYPELRPLVVKYVKKIIKLNDEHDTVWANDETQAGVNAVFNLIEASEEYLPLYIDLIRSCSDGEHDVYQFEHAQTILEKYGWKAETLPVIIQRVLVDIYASEFFKTDAAKEFLSKEENINLLIKAFFKEVQGTHYSRNDFHFKVLAKFVFSDKAEEYGELLYDYSQKGKTPTVVLLKKGANVINSSKKVKYNYRDYKERINTALRNLGLKELGNDCRCSSKLTESDNMEFGAHFVINEKEPKFVLYLSGIYLNYDKKEGKEKTLKLFNDIYCMLPPDLTEFMYLPKYSTIIAANSVKIFTPDLTSEIIENQLHTLLGFNSWIAKELRQVNAGKKTPDELKSSALEMANNIQLPEPNDSSFEEQLKKYISKTKGLTILKHDTETHSFCIESNNAKTGNKSVGVLTYHQYSKNVSLALPCFQGDIKNRYGEIYKWCEQATLQIDGHVVINPNNNYVMIRHIVDQYTIIDAKSLQKLLLFDLIDCFAPTLAKGIQRIVDGEEPMDVLHDQLVYPAENIEITLPDNLKELGIHGELSERMLLAFNKYGKDFLKEK